MPRSKSQFSDKASAAEPFDREGEPYTDVVFRQQFYSRVCLVVELWSSGTTSLCNSSQNISVGVE